MLQWSSNSVGPYSDLTGFRGSYTNTDFTLPANSPAINAGSTVLAPVTDIRGVRRDAQPDVGAFEAA